MIRKVLVANRGEVAVRIIRACRESGIPSVAIHSDVDQDSLHVKLADESVCIGPARPTESYLNIAAILSAADITEADAIHPGYGFLAENADFADICAKSNILFIGPPTHAIRDMGDKIMAREKMKKAGVPVLPGATISTQSEKKIRKEADRIGYPIILKAAFGGGGRGMKIVRAPEELMSLLQTARTEAGQAFGNDTMYMEKYISSARHIEFQVAADHDGHVITLGERDCTVQRRHQKLIEESLSPTVSDELRRQMAGIINKALRRLKYHNVGTMEFLMDETGTLNFIEMNTRIQVEHPVTEMITGVDLLKTQIALAQGERLTQTQEEIELNGHSIECRINAEDPIKFLPSTGTITDYHVPGGPGVRVDSALYDGYKVLPFYDSLLAKIIVHAETRTAAIEKMKCALGELVIKGIECNVDFHKRVLAHPAFVEGTFDTSFAQHITAAAQTS